jgi:MoaA/NifB/PqqE/SkfB family radical SAM enzyme
MRRTYLKLLKYLLVKEPKTPIQLIHFVTSKCNAKCGHCFFWSKLNTKDELSLDEINRVTKTLQDLVILNISGGEPFLRPDFAEVIKTYYKNTLMKEVTIPTNGTFTEKTRKDCLDILENCPELDLNIVLSLDGIPKIHDEIRQVKDCFGKAVQTFATLKGIQIQYPKLQLSVVSTLTSLNQDTLEEFHAIVKEQVKPDIFGMNLIRGEAKKMELFGVNLENYKKFFALQSRSKKRGLKGLVRDYMNKLRTGMIIRTVQHKKFILPCRAGTLMAVMYEKGEVFPCEMLNSKPLGNVRNYNYNFADLWKSSKTKESAKWIKETKCYCTHECFQRMNILYNPTFVAKHLAQSMFGKSDLINALIPDPQAQDSGEEMIQIGKIRGVRDDHSKSPATINDTNTAVSTTTSIK